MNAGLGRPVISLDTNILFALVDQDQPLHAKAFAFAESLRSRDEVAVCEFVLLELHNLLRNAAVMARPLGTAAAVDVKDFKGFGFARVWNPLAADAEGVRA